MKLLYENTKSTSQDVEKKIEELKKVMSMQMNSLSSGTPIGGTMMSTGNMSMFNHDGVLDPTILQKGIDVIKEQMKDVQREALLIETEMEKRFGDMLQRNTQRRYLPKSLTEELIEHKQKMQELNVKREAGIQNRPDSVVGYAQIREAIQDRLGGPFDYASFHQDVRGITSELEQITRDFKLNGS